MRRGGSPEHWRNHLRVVDPSLLGPHPDHRTGIPHQWKIAAGTVVVLAAVLKGSSIAPSNIERLQLPDRTPIAGPAIPSVDVLHPENGLPNDVRQIIEARELQEWRLRVPEDQFVEVHSFRELPDIRRGRTFSEVGMYTRSWPSEQGALASSDFWIPWGQEVVWHYEIVVKDITDNIVDSWAKIYYVDPAAHLAIRIVPPSYHVFAKLGPGFLEVANVIPHPDIVEYHPPRPAVYNWPRPQQ